MKTITTFAITLLLTTSIAMAAPSGATQIDVDEQRTQTTETAEPAKCPSGELKVAGKCHEKAEPCLTDSECCSNKCDGACD